ncbi:MAG: hypothetical protein LBG06_03330 [Deltaproteobacteria bacterium]|jgi:hypothetical protein|nr:hypothetical protein [Deltaproteobacteria bacterium]
MSSRSILNLTPEQRKILEEARRLREEAERALREEVRKAIEAREAKLQSLVADQREELIREGLARLKGSGRLETAAGGAGAGGPAGSPEALDIVGRCQAYYREIGEISPEAARALDFLMGELAEGMDRSRMLLIFDSVRVALAKEITIALRTELHRRELAGFVKARPAGAPGDELVRRVNALAAQRRIRAEDMESVRAEYLSLLEADRVAAIAVDLMRRTREQLSERGYHMLDAKGKPVGAGLPLARDGVYYFVGANPDYRVRCQVDRQGGLNLQQMRVVASKEELKALASSYAREVEASETRKWCEAQREATEALEREGVKLTHSVLRETGSGPLPVLVDRHKDRFSRAAQSQLQSGRPLAARRGGEGE